MKYSVAILAAAGIAQAQTSANVGSSCPKTILVVARGSTEPGNIGITVGPALCSGLKSKLGAANFGCEGIAYPASIGDNMQSKGTSESAINTAVSTFKKVAQQCPNSSLQFMGYSQGAALMHSTIPALPENIRNKISGGVLFGDTKNKQSGGKITNFPSNKLQSYCVSNDGVCGGGLSVTAGHLAYTGNGDATKAVNFLAQQAKSGSGGGAGEALAPVSSTVDVEPAAAAAPQASGSTGIPQFGGSSLSDIIKQLLSRFGQ